MISSPVTISYGLDHQQMSSHVADFLGGAMSSQVGASCGEAANLVDNHGGSYWVSRQIFIAMIRKKWSLSDLRWSNVRRGQKFVRVRGESN